MNPRSRMRRFRESVVTRSKPAYRWGRRRIRPVLKHIRARLRLYLLWLAVAGAVAVGIWSLVNFWDWLQVEGVGEVVGKESGSTTVRNIGLVVAGVVALPLALWRSWVAQRQADTAQQTLLNERYQRGAEMLGSNVLAVRLGGIYALQRLAKEHPENYHIEIMKLFCAFVRNPTVESIGEAGQVSQENGEMPETHESRGYACPRQDVEAIMEAIATRTAVGIDIEEDIEFRYDFRRADLSDVNLLNFRGVKLGRARLADANLSGIWLPPYTNLSSIRDGYEVNLSKARLNRVNFRLSNLWKSDLSCSILIGADLQNTDLRFTNLSNATLANANLAYAELRGANLSGTKFSLDDYPPARGLTQDRIDKARADPDDPPQLDGVLDAYTRVQLVWRGNPPDDTPA